MSDTKFAKRHVWYEVHDHIWETLSDIIFGSLEPCLCIYIQNELSDPVDHKISFNLIQEELKE